MPFCGVVQPSVNRSCPDMEEAPSEAIRGGFFRRNEILMHGDQTVVVRAEPINTQECST